MYNNIKNIQLIPKNRVYKSLGKHTYNSIQESAMVGKTLIKPMRKTYEPQQRNYIPMTSARILFGVILLFLLILLSFGNFGRC